MKGRVVINPPDRHIIPDYLLPKQCQGKGYSITKDGEVYGLIGTKLIPQTSPNGLGHPLIFNRNLWFIYASMFIPNPNNYKHVIEWDGKIIWISYDKYCKIYKALNPNMKAPPISEEVKQTIKDMWKKNIPVSEIADTLGVSRWTVSRYKE